LAFSALTLSEGRRQSKAPTVGIVYGMKINGDEG